MKERPILFSAPMVRALIGGSKTQTRRIVKPQPTNMGGVVLDSWHWVCKKLDAGYCHTNRDAMIRLMLPHNPYGQPGDRLWVRESHCLLDVTKSAVSELSAPLDTWNVTVEYSDGQQHELSVEGDKPKQTRERGETCWRPSIHMPRWASRIALEITNVRVERLQGISEADAAAEGVFKLHTADMPYPMFGSDENTKYWEHSAAEAFRALWSQINGADSWAANPWVWCVEFKRVTA